MSEIDLDLTRLNFELEDENVKILPLVDNLNLRIDGINLNLTKDQETEAPLWIARILDENKTVKILGDDVISPRSIRSIAHQEGEKRSLLEIDPLLYRRVHHEIKRLKKENTNNARRKLTSIEGSFNTILRLRFRKILNLSTIGHSEDNYLKTLSKEEAWLYQKLNNLFKSWNNNVGSMTAGE